MPTGCVTANAQSSQAIASGKETEMNPIENILQIVINDGDGSQCGLSYPERCNLVREKAPANEWLYLASTVNRWLKKNHSARIASQVELLKAATAIAEYYVQHVKEFENG
jgi:hypothetical protein